MGGRFHRNMQLASFGSAAFFIAGGLGVGVSSGMAIKDWKDYNRLRDSSQANLKQHLALTSAEQADNKFSEAVLSSAFAFLEVAGVLTRGWRTMSYRKGARQTAQAAGESARYLVRNRFNTITVEQFKNSKQIQREVFELAQSWRTEQKQFMRSFLDDNKIDAEFVTILKRNNFDEFVDGVIAKCERNGYSMINQMDDIVRGRVDARSGVDVQEIFRSLYRQNNYRIKGYEPLRRGPKGKTVSEADFGYPRYHIILENKNTKITHEWQIGTKAVSKVFEYKEYKIVFPHQKLYKYFNPDLHDVEYDIFRQLWKKHPEYDVLVEELKIPQFCKKVDKVAGKAGRLGEKMSKEELSKEMIQLHDEASTILKKMYDKKGLEFILQFAH